MKLNERGYIALMLVIIIQAVAIVITFTLLTVGTDRLHETQVNQRQVQARGMANACIDEALQQIHDNIAFSGTNSVSLGGNSCTYTVTVVTGSTRTILASGTAGNVVRNIQVGVTISSTSISISSWQEVG